MTDNESKTRTVFLIYHEGSEVGKDCYVGSTSQALSKRLANHRSAASRPGNENNKLYRRMQEIGLRNWVIRPLETMICSEDEIRKLEHAWCEEFRSDLNCVSPIRLGKKKSGETEGIVRNVYMIHNKNSKNGKDSYIGSTAQSLESRLAAHRSRALQTGSENNKFYRRMREVGLKNWEIVPLLTLVCTRDEIRTFERNWAVLLEADLNLILPMTTAEELRRRNSEYYANNRKEILKQQAEYREKNRKEIHKQQAEYREKNRKTIRERAAAYREKIKESKKFFCETCEVLFVSHRDQRNHNETLKHQYAFLNSLD